LPKMSELVQNCLAMKRKLLDASLVVFGAALLVRITVAFAPHGFHLPRLMREDSNAAMVMSAALAISLGLSILAPHIKLPRHLSPRLRTAMKITAALVGAWLLVAVIFFVYGFASGIVHGRESKTPAPQVTWDDQK